MRLDYSKLKQSPNLLTQQDKKIILSSKIKSRIHYGLPLYLGENESVLQKIESTYMFINRIILGGYNWRTNKTKVCNEIKVDLPRQSMCKASVRFMHKHIHNQKCKAILDQLVIPRRKISMIHVRKPQAGQYHASIDRLVELYNKLPPKVKPMSMGQLKKYLKNNDIKTI